MASSPVQWQGMTLWTPSWRSSPMMDDTLLLLVLARWNPPTTSAICEPVTCDDLAPARFSIWQGTHVGLVS